MPAFDEQDYTKSFQWGIWKRLMPVMRPYRRDFAGMFAFNLITAAMEKAFSKGEATNDLARFMPEGKSLGTKEFGDCIISLL